MANLSERQTILVGSVGRIAGILGGRARLLPLVSHAFVGSLSDATIHDLALEVRDVCDRILAISDDGRQDHSGDGALGLPDSAGGS